MKRVGCELESEVLAAALESRWPERVDASLRAHAAVCVVCSDTLAVANAMEQAREEIRACALVPAAGRVWWRAQLRAQREAAEVAQRPITLAQMVAFGCAVGLLGACIGATSTWFQFVLGRITASLAAFNMQALIAVATAFVAEHGVLLVAFGAVLLLVPAAACVAILKD